MLLDKGLRSAITHFSTLFFLVAIVTAPVHIAHSYFFREVIATSELHPEIEQLPPKQNLHGVSADELAAARLVYVVLAAVEIALIPAAIKATGRVLERSADGKPTTALDAWRHLAGSRLQLSSFAGQAAWGPLLAAGLGAVILGYLLRAVGLVLVEPLSDADSFAGVGLIEGLARAGAAPFFLAAAAVCAQTAKDAAPARPNLY